MQTQIQTRWTTEEIENLILWTSQEVSFEEQGRRFGRTARAVQSKVERDKLRAPRKLKWPPEIVEQMRIWTAQGFSTRKQAELLQRPLPAVRDKLSRLRFRPSRAWTAEQEQTLRELHLKGWSNQRKADALGRTCHAVKRRVHELGLGRAPVKPWSEQDIANLKKWVAENVLRRTIARRLGRCEGTVKDRITMLGIGRPQPCQAWTDAETESLRVWKAKGYKIKRMAKRLGRTKAEVRGKLKRMGLVKKRKGPWTTGDLEKIAIWQKEGVKGVEQARRLGRTYAAWSSAVQIHNLQRETPNTRLDVMTGITAGLDLTGITAKLKRRRDLVSRIINQFVKAGLVRKLKKSGPYEVTRSWTRVEIDDN